MSIEEEAMNLNWRYGGTGQELKGKGGVNKLKKYIVFLSEHSQNIVLSLYKKKGTAQVLSNVQYIFTAIFCLSNHGKLSPVFPVDLQFLFSRTFTYV